MGALPKQPERRRRQLGGAYLVGQRDRSGQLQLARYALLHQGHGCLWHSVHDRPTPTPDDGGTTWVDWDTTNLQTAAITGTGTYWLSVYPGIATAANASRNDILPRNFRAAWTISGGTRR